MGRWKSIRKARKAPLRVIRRHRDRLYAPQSDNNCAVCNHMLQEPFVEVYDASGRINRVCEDNCHIEFLLNKVFVGRTI